MSRKLIQAYYDAFNQVDLDKFCSFLATDVIHDINHGKREIGLENFRTFMINMFEYYDESIHDLIILEAGDGVHFAAEFTVDGVYKKSAPSLPKANQQQYSLKAGAFFEIQDNKIKRVTTYYNVNDWLQQVS